MRFCITANNAVECTNFGWLISSSATVFIGSVFGESKISNTFFINFLKSNDLDTNPTTLLLA